MREPMTWHGLVGVLSLVLVSAGCKGNGDGGSSTSASGSPGGSASREVTISGAGSTFVNPILSKWVAEYQALEKNSKVNYQSIGSGAGIKAISDKTVDFGATDAPMSDEQLGKAGGKLIHIPITLGAVVITYNVPGAPDHLNLTPEVLSAIFLHDITSWSDAKIASLNPTAKLPAQTIGVVYRSDGSGTTAVFTDYLAKVSPAWKDKVGTGTSVKWPTGTGANKNDGVANQIKSTPGAIGYVELAFALQTKQPVAMLKNHAGKFVEPSLDAITASAAGAAAKMPDDMRISIVDAEGDASYPISAFTYVLVYDEMSDAAKGQALANFLWWGLHDGQKMAPALHYAPLPAAIVTKAEARLKLMKASGKPLLAGK